jgi:hypothetical protein
MMISLARVSTRWQKTIVLSGDTRGAQQGGETQQRFSAEKRLFTGFDVSHRWGKHPHRDLQPLASWGDDGDRAIAPLGPTRDA